MKKKIPQKKLNEMANAVERAAHRSFKKNWKLWTNPNALDDLDMQSMALQDFADAMRLSVLIRKGALKKAATCFWNMDTAATDNLPIVLENFLNRHG